MAGERKASLKIIGSSWDDADYIEIWFKNQNKRFTYSQDYYRGDRGTEFTGGASGNFEAKNNARWNDLTAKINTFLNTTFPGEYLVTHTSVPPVMVLSTHTILIEALAYGNNYSLTNTLAKGAGNDVTVVRLDNISPITVVATPSFITCGGSSTGSIILNVLNAVGAVTYQWSNGTTSGSPVLAGVPAGNYSVTVIDSQGTSTVLNNIIVTGNDRIEILGTINGRDIEIEVSGGVAPYNFRWADGPTTQSRTNLNTGNYSVTVTDSNGCQRAGSFLVKNEWFYFSQNPIPLSLAAASPETKPNLSFICEVWVEEVYLSNSFTLVYTGEQPADASGKTTFYVEEILDTYLQAHFPAFGQTTLAKATGAFKRFQLKYREKYGTPPVPDSIATQSIRIVVLGGLDFEENATKTFFSSYLTYQKPFFTWQPNTKKVVPDQPEYLFYMPLDLGTSAFTVKTKLYFTGSTSEQYTLFSQAGAKQFELWIVPAGFNLLKLQAKAGEREVLRYEIWVEDTATGNKVSEVRNFVVDKSYYRTRRYFHYVNSIGGIDTLMATGAAATNLPIETETVAKNLRPGYSATEGDLAIVSRGGRPYLALSTGYQLGRAERIALQDFRLSDNVKLLSPDRYMGGQVVFKNTEVDDEFDNVKSMDFEFHMAYRNHYTGNLKRKGYSVPKEETPIPFDPGYES